MLLYELIYVTANLLKFPFTKPNGEEKTDVCFFFGKIHVAVLKMKLFSLKE